MSTSDTLYVQHGGETYEVAPLGDGGQTVDEFYSYSDPDGASANTDLEESGTSQMFLYHGSGGTSLVFIHDEPQDGSGGTANVSFGSPPSGASWAVKDDSGDASYSASGASWNWSPCCTDGGALHGGLDTEFRMTVSASFTGITNWIFRDANGDNIQLTPGQPVTLSSRQPTRDLPDAANFDFDILDSLEQCGFQGQNEGQFGTKDCPSRPSGRTPPLIYYDVTIACDELLSFDIAGRDVNLGDETVLDMWIGLDPAMLCWWVGTNQPETCTRLDEACSIMQSAQAIGVTQGLRIAGIAIEALEENTNQTYPEAIRTVLVVVILAIIAVIEPTAGGEIRLLKKIKTALGV